MDLGQREKLMLYKEIVEKISVGVEKKLKQKEYLKEGLFEVVDQGQSLVGGFSNDSSLVVKCDLPVIVFGDHTKCVKFIDFPFIAGADGVKVLQAKECVDAKFLYYYTLLLTKKMIDKGYARHYQFLEKMEVEIPSADEQKRIVNKIEELFSELDSAVETLKKTKEQLAVYRQAVLKEAFEREKDGKFLKIKDFANVGTGATPLKTRQDYYNGDIAWVSSGKVNDKKIYTPTAYITEKALEETNCSVYPAHTIVVAMYGEGKTRGQCAELMIDAATNQALAAIVLQDNAVICKDFLLWFLTFNYEELRRKAAGGVQPNLNLNLVKTISVPYCDMDTQMKIISEIESKLTVCENIEKTVNDALIQADAMRQSILKKAFEGSL